MSDSPVEFVQHNILLIAVAVVSGGMLIWPYLRGGVGGGASVDAAGATRLINREDAVVVDVREPNEYGAGHILGARNLPLSRIADGAAELAKRKAKPIILYCDSGNRSAKAVGLLKKQGFERVVNLAGGIAGWRQAGLPVEK